MNAMKWMSMLACLLAITTAVKADDGIFDGPVIEPGDLNDTHGAVGAGATFGTLHSPRLLVGIQYRGLPEEAAPGESLRLFWVRTVLSPAAKGSKWGLPAFSLEIKPFEKVYDVTNQYNKEHETERLGVHILKTKIHRDIDLGNTGMSIHVIGIDLNVRKSETATFTSYLKLTADLLGYSWVQNALKQKAKETSANNDKNNGLYLFGFGISGGYEQTITGQKSSEGLRIQFFPINGHANFATNRIDVNVYSKIALVMRNKYSEWAAFAKAGVEVDSANLLLTPDPENTEAPNNFFLTTGLQVNW